jgi:hypothetical protein
MKLDAVSRFLRKIRKGVPGTPSLVCAAVAAAILKHFACERVIGITAL